MYCTNMSDYRSILSPTASHFSTSKLQSSLQVYRYSNLRNLTGPVSSFSLIVRNVRQLSRYGV